MAGTWPMHRAGEASLIHLSSGFAPSELVRSARLRLGIRRVHAFQLHWSPDGRSLLAQGRSPKDSGPGGKAFYRIDAHTGEITPILMHLFGLPSNNPEVTQSEMEWPVWSFDGEAIFYRRSDALHGDGEQSLAARGRSTFSELRWYPPMEAAKGSLSWVFGPSSRNQSEQALKTLEQRQNQ